MLDRQTDVAHIRHQRLRNVFGSVDHRRMNLNVGEMILRVETEHEFIFSFRFLNSWINKLQFYFLRNETNLFGDAASHILNQFVRCRWRWRDNKKLEKLCGKNNNCHTPDWRDILHTDRARGEETCVPHNNFCTLNFVPSVRACNILGNKLGNTLFSHWEHNFNQTFGANLRATNVRTRKKYSRISNIKHANLKTVDCFFRTTLQNEKLDI